MIPKPTEETAVVHLPPLTLFQEASRDLLLEAAAGTTGLTAKPWDASTSISTLKKASRQFERNYILAVLRRHKRVSDAARVLGIQRPNLYRKMHQLGIRMKKTYRVGASS